MRPLLDIRRTDHAIAEIARWRNGIVRLDQLRDAGITRAEIRARVAAGRLHPRHEGVFAVGHPGVTVRGDMTAAADALGPDAGVSHLWAAWHLGMWRREPARPIDVIVPRTSGHTDRLVNADRTRPSRVHGFPAEDGIRVHRCASLEPEDLVEVDGVRCTTPLRAIVDCMAVLSPRGLERLLAQAEFLGVLDLPALERRLKRIARPRGVRMLRALLEAGEFATTRTDSGVEELLLAALRSIGAPTGLRGIPIPIGDGRHAVPDVFYDAEALVVECDGPHHDLPAQRRHDEWRDERLRRRGVEVVRYHHTRVEDDAVACAFDVLARLEARRMSRGGC